MQDKILHKKGAKGFSEQMANEINRHQASKVHSKITSRKFHPPKKGQGYTQSRPSVDKF